MLKSSVQSELNCLRARFCNGARIHEFMNHVCVIVAELSICPDEIPLERQAKIIRIMDQIRKMAS
jgi:hypothetical protein